MGRGTPQQRPGGGRVVCAAADQLKDSAVEEGCPVTGKPVPGRAFENIERIAGTEQRPELIADELQREITIINRQRALDRQCPNEPAALERVILRAGLVNDAIALETVEF